MTLRTRHNKESWQSFSYNANRFLKNTEKYVRQENSTPGDYYKALWCRDAAYILKDRFLFGDVPGVMQSIYFIWSHQIAVGKEKVVFGRGSPDMDFLSQEANSEEERWFEGSLPTTIYDNFSEVYAKNPDIDSTALMVSTTSWIFNKLLLRGQATNEGRVRQKKHPPSLPNPKKLNPGKGKDKPSSAPDEVIGFAVPRMLKATDYLLRRDIDGDGLLEQDHNEDWMDTVLRAGKIVYDQASTILALSNLSSLLRRLGRESEADQMMKHIDRIILAVEEHLWSGESGCYMDKQVSHHLGRAYKTLTQDVSLYLVAITENTVHDMLGSGRSLDGEAIKEGRNDGHLPFEKAPAIYDDIIRHRAERTLDAIKNLIWKEKWPLVTEAEMKTTGPWVLNPNQYHNHTFWPWITGIEMLARSRFRQFDECNSLLSFLIRGKYPDILAFHEWVDPLTGKGSGAFPFRTGISAIRIALTDILSSMQNTSADTKKT